MALRTVFKVEGVIGLPPDAEGQPVGWSVWHLARLADAMAEETGDKDITWYPDEYIFKEFHLYEEDESRVWDRGGEPGVTYRFAIPAGAIYHCFRDR